MSETEIARIQMLWGISELAFSNGKVPETLDRVQDYAERFGAIFEIRIAAEDTPGMQRTVASLLDSADYSTRSRHCRAGLSYAAAMRLGSR